MLLISVGVLAALLLVASDAGAAAQSSIAGVWSGSLQYEELDEVVYGPTTAPEPFEHSDVSVRLVWSAEVSSGETTYAGGTLALSDISSTASWTEANSNQECSERRQWFPGTEGPRVFGADGSIALSEDGTYELTFPGVEQPGINKRISISGNQDACLSSSEGFLPDASFNRWGSTSPAAFEFREPPHQRELPEGTVGVETDSLSGSWIVPGVGPEYSFRYRWTLNFSPTPEGSEPGEPSTPNPPTSPPGPPEESKKSAEDHPPTAHKDAGESTGKPTSGNVLANDTDPDGDPLTLTSYTQGAFGNVECSPSGDCTYTPSNAYTNHDSFSYTISDGRGGTSSARDFIRPHPLPSDGFLVLKQKASYGCGYLRWSFPAIEEAQFSLREATDRCSYAYLLGSAGGRVKTPCPAPGSKHYTGASLRTHVPIDGIHPLKVCTYDTATKETSEFFEDVASPAYLYAPVVYLAKGESYRPGSTNEFLEHSRVVLDKPDEPTESTPGQYSGSISKVDNSCDDQTLRAEIGGNSASDLAAAKKLGRELADYAMHPWAARAENGTLVCRQKSDTTRFLTKQKGSDTGVVLDADSSIYPGASVGDIAGGHVPVYAVYVPHKYVSYWFFYPYNGFDHKYLYLLHAVELHQGDWEHITVDLHKGANTLDEDEPSDVDYYQHIHCDKKIGAELEDQGTLELISPDGGFQVQGGTHPVVYSALGGHASYPDERNGNELACRDEGYGDVADKGAAWDTYKSIDDATRQPWWGFTGNWGSKVSANGLDIKILHFGPAAPGPARTR